jgi:hypothetical protein
MLEPWVVCINHATTLKGLTAHTPNPFRVKFIFCLSEPRVLAMLEPWVVCINHATTLKGLTPNPFRVKFIFCLSEPWAEISQRLRRLIASTFGV